MERNKKEDSGSNNSNVASVPVRHTITGCVLVISLNPFFAFPAVFLQISVEGYLEEGSGKVLIVLC